MKKLVYYNNTELEGIKYISKVVDFGLGLSVISAFNECLSTLFYLKDTPMFRREVKYECRLALKLAQIKENTIRSNMKSREFWEDYSDHVIDVAEKDVTIFRIALKNELDKAVPEYSNLFSYVECARVLLDMTVKHFDVIMSDGRKKFGRDFSKDFAEYRPEDVLFHWDKLCKYLYKGIQLDLNTDATIAAFDVVCAKFSEGSYIHECLAEAKKNHAEFANVVIVREDGTTEKVLPPVAGK